jgi:Mg2+ and Co2+ transporter CorA
VSDIELRWFDDDGVSSRRLDELSELLQRTDGFCWLDVGVWSPEAERLLTEEFAFHPMAIRDFRERNHVPRVHVYVDHLFVVVHAPEIGERGHVHYLELDHFIGERFLVTVHGPISPRVPPHAALREVRSVIERVEDGRLRPTSPFGLTYAICGTCWTSRSAWHVSVRANCNS